MNAALLEYHMKLNNVSNGTICKKLNISRSAFYRKCKGETQFTVKEVKDIVKILNLDSPCEIFFKD